MLKQFFKQRIHSVLLLVLFLLLQETALFAVYHLYGVWFNIVVGFVNTSASQKNFFDFLKIAVVMLSVLVVQVFLITVFSFLLTKQLQLLGVYLKEKFSSIFLQKVSKVKIKDLKNSYSSNVLFARLNNDLEQSSSVILSGTLTLLMSLIGIIVAFVFLAWHHVLFALTVLVVFLITQSVVLFSGKFLKKKQLQLSVSNQKYSENLQDVLNNFRTLFFSKRTHLLHELTYKNSDQQIDDEAKKTFVTALVRLFGNIFAETRRLGLLFSAFVLLFFAQFSGYLTVGTAFSIYLLLARIGSHFTSLFSSITAIRSIKVVTNKLNVDIDETTKDSSTLTSLAINSQTTPIITLKDITFGNKERALVQNFSFQFEAGKKYAIVGPSGSGKTTLLNIILGLEEGFKGEVYINGFNYKEINTDFLHKFMAYVPVDSFVFDAPIKENVTLWKSEEDEKFQEALRMANLKEELESLDKMNSSAFELSEGQKQRLALARAFFLSRPLLIFDEAFANLDSKNIEIIKRNIKKLKNQTVIFVTHHLESKDKFFDKIIDISPKSTL